MKSSRHFHRGHHARTRKKKANAFQQSEAFRQMTRLEKNISLRFQRTTMNVETTLEDPTQTEKRKKMRQNRMDPTKGRRTDRALIKKEKEKETKNKGTRIPF